MTPPPSEQRHHQYGEHGHDHTAHAGGHRHGDDGLDVHSTNTLVG